jgi:ComF family protein
MLRAGSRRRNNLKLRLARDDEPIRAMNLPAEVPPPDRSWRRSLASVARLFWGLPQTMMERMATTNCAGCDGRLDTRTVFCPVCANALVRCDAASFSPVQVHAFGEFGGPLADAIRRLKYGDRPDLAGALGELLRTVARDSGIHADVIVPVPLDSSRLAARRYNQAALLARCLVTDLAAPLDTDALLRRRHTAPQAVLDASARQENLRGAFVVARPDRMRRQNIVLVDDVVTTGATVRACADVLFRAGAASVVALALARAV